MLKLMNFGLQNVYWKTMGGRMKMFQKSKYLEFCSSVSLRWVNFKYFNLEIACILCYFIELEVFYTSQDLSAITDKLANMQVILCVSEQMEGEQVCVSVSGKESA